MTTTDAEKSELKNMLASELPVLRAKMRMTQDALTKAIGISRQTYTALETGRREMTWNIFVLLYLYFESHEETKGILQTMGNFTDRTQKLLTPAEAPYLKIMARGDEKK